MCVCVFVFAPDLLSIVTSSLTHVPVVCEPLLDGSDPGGECLSGLCDGSGGCRQAQLGEPCVAASGTDPNNECFGVCEVM